MTNANFTVNQDVESALNRIVEYRRLILNSGYDSLFSHGEVNEKRRRSDHIFLCGMIDELCEAVEGEVHHG